MATKKKTDDDVDFAGLPGDPQVVPSLHETVGFTTGVLLATVSLRDSDLGRVHALVFIGDPSLSIAALNLSVNEFDEQVAAETGELDGWASVTMLVELDSKRRGTPSKVNVWGQSDQLKPEYKTAIRRAFLSDLNECVVGHVIDLVAKPEKKTESKDKASATTPKAKAVAPASSAAAKAPAKRAAAKRPAPKTTATTSSAASKKAPAKKRAAASSSKAIPTAAASKRVKRTPATAKPANTVPAKSVSAD